MIIVNTLKSRTENGVSVSAYTRQDGFYARPAYAVTVFDGAVERLTVKAARTTWKKRFEEMTAQYLRG